MHSAVHAEAARLHAAGYTVVGLRLTYDAVTARKRLHHKQAWQTAVHESCMTAFLATDDDALAVVTGDPSDLLAVDLDRPKAKDIAQGTGDAVAVVQELIDRHGLDASTPMARTASGGQHLLFSLSKSLAAGLSSAKNGSKLAGLTLDTRGDDGCILVYPSQVPHPDDPLPYTWQSPVVPVADLLAAPAWLIDLLNQRPNVAGPPALKRRRTTAPTGEAFTMRVQSEIQKLGPSQLMGTVWQRQGGIDFRLADPVCTCPLCGHTHTSNNYCARVLVEQAFTLRNYSTSCRPHVFGWEASRLISNLIAHPATDDPWAEILRAVHQLQGRELRYTTAKRFLCFSGHVWEVAHVQTLKQDIKALAHQVIKPLVRDIPRSEANAAKVKALNAGVRYIQKAHSISTVLQSFETLSFSPDIEQQLDTDRDLLAVGNGVVELPTGTLRQGKTYDNLSIHIATDLKPDAPTPLIDAFFADVFNGDADVVAYMQRLLGYAITGHTREQVWAIWTGTGSNGKGVLMDLLKELLGPFTVTMPGELLFETGKTTAGASTPHLQTLIKKRLGFKDEGKAEKANVLNEELIKTVTGSSTITTRPLYKDYLEFQPSHLPVLLCNRRPKINIDDQAMLRRIVVIPFANVYTSPGAKNNPYDPDNPHHRLKDDGLREKLLSQAGQEQLLAWLVRGAVSWYGQGLGAMPTAIGAAWDSYIEENDTLAAFVAERCVLGADMSVNAKDFRQAYVAFADTRVQQKHLQERMRSRGFKYTSSTRAYGGLCLV